MLVVKTMNAFADPSGAARLRTAVAKRPDTVLLDASLTDDRQIALTALSDCYVSLHRAEGFGLGLAEAMALGRPVIATGYSGNLDFMTDENGYLVPYGLVPIDAGVGPYPAAPYGPIPISTRPPGCSGGSWSGQTKRKQRLGALSSTSTYADSTVRDNSYARRLPGHPRDSPERMSGSRWTLSNALPTI